MPWYECILDSKLRVKEKFLSNDLTCLIKLITQYMATLHSIYRGCITGLLISKSNHIRELIEHTDLISHRYVNKQVPKHYCSAEFLILEGVQ